MAPTTALEHRLEPEQRLAALRAGGSDPVRLRHIEALARRAAQQEGTARRLLDARVQQLLAATAGAPARPSAPHLPHEPATRSTATSVSTSTCAAAPQAPAAPVQPLPTPRLQTLADLLAHINRHGHAAAPGAAPGSGAPELKAVRDYRSTWSRLSVEHRLTQALAKVPDNAGPLNTQRLLHEALAAMRHASPQYLHRFMVQVEALLWLDQVNQGAAVVGTRAGTRKPRA